MIVPVAVDVRFRQVQPVVDEVADRAKSILARYLEPTGYAFISRLKQLPSLVEKLETGRYRNWSEVDDLFACAVVVPTLAEEATVLSEVSRLFRLVELRRRGTTHKNPRSFQFDATRAIVTLMPTLSPEPADALSTLRFEVQIRTAFEHAWVVASHSLVYKGERVDWRRARLSAHLKASSEQLDHLIAGFDAVSAFIPDESWPEVIIQKMLEDTFRLWFETSRIPPECAPVSWARFSSNVYSLLAGSYGGSRALTFERASQALSLISTAIDRHGGERFPRSISLLQFVLGVLVTEGVAKDPLTRYCPVVTDALISLFPATAGLVNRFDFQSA